MERNTFPAGRRKIRYTVMFPPRMLKALRAAAEEHGRSLSEESIKRLEEVG